MLVRASSVEAQRGPPHSSRDRIHGQPDLDQRGHEEHEHEEPDSG